MIENGFVPKIVVSIPREFNISYSRQKVVNSNYANLKEVADAYTIPFIEVDSVDGMRIKDYEPVLAGMKLDLILVLGWYYMIPKSTRELAKYGAWGIHTSLLPKYAGGAPLVWAIINGEKETSVTLFRMDDGVDDGDIIAQRSFDIGFEDSIKEVYQKATDTSKDILQEVLADIENVCFVSQDKSAIEYYPQRSPEDGMIDWNQSAQKIYDFIRAQSLPYPCAFSVLGNVRLKFLNSKVIDLENFKYRIGEIVRIDDKAMIATKDKFIEPETIIDGEKQFQFKDYARVNNLWGGYSRAKNFRVVAQNIQ